ncbi:MAG: 4a-hydroxytetrahydrobiopterin dehydratase [Actinobacteria bacterium]|nr:4a-hydroxytetrahydrobiopterin dehydratase [Actinomycetota bacterium]MCI0678617.1 4a-hydroxytetrahydrobiopterin dehydratase [Actinomycetota bacterium]
MALSSETEITTFLEGHPGWSHVSGELTRTFAFTDFAGSMRFVDKVAEVAEDANHHPDILIRWNRVTLTLSTHTEGGVTPKDLALVTVIDRI